MTNREPSAEMMRLVPREPTSVMEAAGDTAACDDLRCECLAENIWRAMWDAAPTVASPATPEIDAIRGRLEAATKGPWHVTTNMDYWVEHTQPRDEADQPKSFEGEAAGEPFTGIAHCGDIHWPNYAVRQQEWEANADFIAHAPTDIATLLSALDTQERTIGELREREGSLFNAIKHGDEEHRQWLKTAIDAHFAGDRVPPPTGKGNKEAALAERDRTITELREALAGEREACAKVAENLRVRDAFEPFDAGWTSCADEIAADIRSLPAPPPEQKEGR